MTEVDLLRPQVPDDLSTIVKPEELVDIVEMTPLTLQDRRIYNILIGNAWNHIFDRRRHEISRAELTRYTDSNNHDLAASLRRLMSAIVVVKLRHNHNGRPSTRQIQLLGGNDIEDRKGPIQYSFPDELIQIIKNTQIFARLHTRVMFELTSKYSLALYEFLQRRCNMTYVSSETMTVEEARGLLGVPKDKLASFGHFNKYALQIATREVSFLTEFDLVAEPVKTGRAVTHVRFRWERKTDIGAQIAAVEELERSKVGRQARMQGKVVSITSSSQKTDSSRRRLTLSLVEQGRTLAKTAGTGWDIHVIAQEFHAYIDRKGPPDNLERAWLGFVRKKTAAEPGQ